MWLEYQLLEPKMAEAVPSDHGSGCKGRPSIELDVDNVKHLLSLGFSKSKVRSWNFGNKSKDSLQQDCTIS